MRIEYIGSKARKVDNVAGTLTVWNGPGDIKDVPDGIAGKLLAHADVWRNADAPRRAAAPIESEAQIIARLTAERDKLLAERRLAEPAVLPVVALHGSDLQPALIQIGDAQVQLGDVVAAALAMSGLTPDAWNALPVPDREARIASQVELLRAAAAPAAPQSDVEEAKPKNKGGRPTREEAAAKAARA